jgi:site-specific DNA recombinase
VRRLLVNPRYAGLQTHRGKVIGKGDWTPLIDENASRAAPTTAAAKGEPPRR